MEFVATLLLFALTAVAAEPPYLNDAVTPGNCSDFNAEAWMEFLPKPLELNVQYELAPEAEEIHDYTEPLHLSDPDYDPLDSESTDDDDTEHLGELVRRRREVGNESSVDSTATPVSTLDENGSANASDEDDLEEVPLALLRLKKCHRNNRAVLPNQPNKVMLKNFQKAKMSFFLTFESHDAEACGVGSISSDHYFKKLQGCWLEHKHKAHEICRQKHGKRFGWHGRRHHGRGRHFESHDHSDEEHSVTGLQDDANGTVSDLNDGHLNDTHTLDEVVNEIVTENERGGYGRYGRGHSGRRDDGHHHHDGHDDHDDGHDDHDDGHDDHDDRHDHHDDRHDHHDDGHDDHDDGHDSHDDRHDHHDRHHHGGRHGGRGHRRHHHHHDRDDNDDRGRHGGRGHRHHHHHHDHDDNDDGVQVDDVSATSTVPLSRRSHDFVPAEGEVLTCDNAIEGWMEPESKLVLQYVTPGCGCFEINVHVSFPTDTNSSLVLTPEANEEYLHIYECVDSHTSEEDSGENHGEVDMDGIDPANILDDDSDENQDDKRDDEEENDSHEDDGDNAIDSDEANYAGNERGLIKRKLRNRTIRIWEDDNDDDDDDDDDDDEEDDDDEDAGVSRRSSRRRRAPEEEADQQAVDRREERRRRRQENQRRRAERRRSRGRGNEGDQTGDVAANTVDTGDAQATRQERRRLRQQRRQQRRQQQGNGNRRGRGRGDRRRGNAEDGDEDFNDEPLAEAVHGSDRAITRLNRRRNRNLQRYRNSARRANRLLLRGTSGFGPKFCCKQGIQHKKASFFPDNTGARAELACENVPSEVPMWGNHKHGVQADECVRLYTSCCQNFSLNQWKDWFTSPSPRDDDYDDDVASTPPTNTTELDASQEQL